MGRTSALTLLLSCALGLSLARADGYAVDKFNPPGSNLSLATGVNASGQVVGWFLNADGRYLG